MPKVYIILVNYNGWRDSIECLESLFKLNFNAYEIILVDNASTNDSVKQIKSWAAGEFTVEPKSSSLAYLSAPVKQKPLKVNFLKEGDKVTNLPECDFTLLVADKNKGFSYGNNLGIKYALENGDASYFWILNNDTVVTENSLASLVSRYANDKTSGIGILGGKVKYYFQPDMLQCAGGGTYFKWLAYSKQTGNQEVDEGQYDSTELNLDLIIGACMFVDVDFINNVGLLSEEYFLYYEEQDWAERAKREGLHLAYEPKAEIYHKEGQSIGASQLDLKGISRLSDFYYARNKIILTKKYFGLLCLLTVYMSFLLIAINRIRRGQSDRLPMLWGILINSKKEFEN